MLLTENIPVANVSVVGHYLPFFSGRVTSNIEVGDAHRLPTSRDEVIQGVPLRCNVARESDGNIPYVPIPISAAQ